jgi:hypothetical protein
MVMDECKEQSTSDICDQNKSIYVLPSDPENLAVNYKENLTYPKIGRCEELTLNF